MLFQMQPASLFVGQEIKSYEEWAREVTIGLSVLVLVVLVATLISQRRRLLEPTAKWLFLFGIVILPAFISTSGSLASTVIATGCDSRLPTAIAPRPTR